MLKPLLFAGIALAMTSTAAFAQVTVNCVTTAAHLKQMHQPLVDQFNASQNEVKVVYGAPTQDYADTHVRMMRASATNTLPDCIFTAFNQTRPLVEALAARNQVTPAADLMAKEGDAWVADNYAPAILELGQVGGIQYGLPFNASVIQWYVNADLVKKAGHDPDNLPTDWDGMIAVAKDIQALGGVQGLSFAVNHWGDDWPWQVLIRSQGGTILNAEGNHVAFNEAGRDVAALTLARRLVEEGIYDPNIDLPTQTTAFAEGRLGLLATSPASATSIKDRVGGAFDLRTAKFTLIDPNGRLPAGGNNMLITTTDPQKVAAVWQYMKFLTGPEGQSFAVQASGYLPTNAKVPTDDYLGEYYRQNPYFATPSTQVDRAAPWAGYPGTQSEKIWREQRDIIHSVMLGDTTIADGAARIVEVTEALMAR